MNVRQFDGGRHGPRVPGLLLLGLGGIGALALLAGLSRKEARAPAQPQPDRQDSVALVSSVYAFSVFASEQQTKTLQRDATAEGLRLLASVLYTLAKRELAEPPTRYATAGEQLMQAAYVIERNTRLGAHAQIVRAALLSATDALADTKYARQARLSRQIQELREAAETIRSEQPLATQGRRIRDCFGRANAVLQTLVEVTFGG